MVSALKQNNVNFRNRIKIDFILIRSTQGYANLIYADFDSYFIAYNKNNCLSLNLSEC